MYENDTIIFTINPKCRVTSHLRVCSVCRCVCVCVLVWLLLNASVKHMTTIPFNAKNTQSACSFPALLCLSLYFLMHEKVPWIIISPFEAKCANYTYTSHHATQSNRNHDNDDDKLTELAWPGLFEWNDVPRVHTQRISLYVALFDRVDESMVVAWKGKRNKTTNANIQEKSDYVIPLKIYK